MQPIETQTHILQQPISGMIKLESLGILKISGTKAQAFLQGQLTCDVLNLDRQTVMGAHCNPQGRVVFLFFLVHFAESFLLLMPRSMITIAKNALQKYAIFYRVLMEEVSQEIVLMGSFRDCQIHHLPIFQLPDTRSVYVCENLTIAKKISENNTLQDENVWFEKNIAHGIPHIYPDTTSLFLPHELNLIQLNAVNFHKGCYTGQEIIARMHYRSKIKKRLYRAIYQGNHEPISGQDIIATIGNTSHICGALVDFCRTKHGYELLLVLDTAMQDHPLFLEKNRLFNLILCDKNYE